MLHELVPLGNTLRQPAQQSSAAARAFFLRTRRSFTTSGRNHAAQSVQQLRDVGAARDYCTNLVKNFDSPSYTLQRFIPPHVQTAYLAIRAFNIEVARIPDLVSNAQVGALRMEFWRKLVHSTFEGRPPAEPVAVLLEHVLSQHNLTKSWFLKLINSRDRLLSHPGYASLSELEQYGENTYSTLLYLILQAIPLNSMSLDHLASHIGKAAGIVAILKGFPILAFPPPPNHHSSPHGQLGMPPSNSRRGQITLPLDVMSQSGVRETDVFAEAGNAPNLKDAVFKVATRASDHLITARTLMKNVRAGEAPDHDYEHEYDEGHEYAKYGTGVRQSAQSRSDELKKGYGVLMGPAVSAQLFLDRLQKVDFDIFDASLRRPEWKLPFVAYWRYRQMQL